MVVGIFALAGAIYHHTIGIGADQSECNTVYFGIPTGLTLRDSCLPSSCCLWL